MTTGTVPIVVGRIFGALALLAMVGTGITQVTGGTVLGMTQQHLFSEATVFALLCIAGLLDGLVHMKGR